MLDITWELSVHAVKPGVLSSFAQPHSLPFLTAVPAAPKLAGNVSGLHDVRPGEVGIALCHLDVGVPEQLRKLVETTARHHVPGSKCVAQIVESKVSNLRSLEQFMETLIRTLTPTGCAWLGRQDAIHSHDSRIPPYLPCEFGWHGHKAHFPFLEPCPHCDQSIAVEDVPPLEAKDLPAPQRTD